MHDEYAHTTAFPPNMVRAGALLGSASDCATKSTAFSAAQDAFAEARNLSACLQSLADRLVGPTPTCDKEAPEPILGGLFPDLEQNAQSASRAITDAHDALNRIERALP